MVEAIDAATAQRELLDYRVQAEARWIAQWLRAAALQVEAAADGAEALRRVTAAHGLGRVPAIAGALTRHGVAAEDRRRKLAGGEG